MKTRTAFSCKIRSLLVPGALLFAASLAYGQATPTPTPTATPVSQITFSGIGFMSGDNVSDVRSVSGDGAVALGYSASYANSAFTNYKPVKWTAAGGFVALPSPAADGTTGPNTQVLIANDITASGARIAYRARPGGTGRRVAMVCAGDGTQATALGRLPNSTGQTAANQISDDGAVVFGFGTGSDGNDHSFRWTSASGIQQLVEPTGYTNSIPAARGVSADGSVSVGDITAFDVNGNETAHQAYRWTAAGGMVGLGYLPGGNRSTTFAVSADGTKVYGVSNSSAAPGNTYFGEWYVWSAATGMQSLGRPAGYDNFSNLGGVSADGALVVLAGGDSTGQNKDDTFILQTSTGTFISLRDLLNSSGIANAISGWGALSAEGISDDGNTLFGNGVDPNGNTQGFILRFPANYLRNYQSPKQNVLGVLSARGAVTTGDNVLVSGFVVIGSTTKKVLIRGLGQSIGLANTLADPVLELRDQNGGVVASNDNWKDSQQAEVEATGRAPVFDNESALIKTLASGNYTAILQGKNGTTGIGEVEVVDIDPASAARLGNIAFRMRAGTGDSALVGGFTIDGPQYEKVLLRAKGPSLVSQGVADALQDPTLLLRDSNGRTVVFNNNWKDTQQADIQATGLPPNDDRESAIVATLPPGSYTAVVSGICGTTGIALAEIYDFGPNGTTSSIPPSSADPVCASPTPTPTPTPTATPRPTPAHPTLTTTASASTAVGGTISDIAHLRGSANATGSITFKAYGPDDATCGGTPVFVSTVSVNGDGDYNSGPTIINTAGVYRFTASYFGDINNFGVAPRCNDPGESVTVSPAPSPTPTATPTTTPTPTATPTPTPIPSPTPTPSPANSISFTAVPLPVNGNASEIRAMTADGTRGVGWAGSLPANCPTCYAPVTWTLQAGLQNLPALPGDGTFGGNGAQFLTASDITPSGSWIAYRTRPGGLGNREAVIASGDFSRVIALGRLAPNEQTSANQISDDGSVVFGFGDGSDGNSHSFRWTAANGIQQLAEPSGYVSSVPTATGVSADGTVSVGTLTANDGTTTQAYRWNGGTALIGLGFLPGGNISAAGRISADGSIIGGYSNSSRFPNGEICVWNSAGQPTALGVPAGFDSAVESGMSADGALLMVVASDSTGRNAPTAFVLQRSTGAFFNLRQLFVDGGIGDQISGWTLAGANNWLGITDDGNTVFGSGQSSGGDTRGFVAHFPPNYLRNLSGFTPPPPGAWAKVNQLEFGRTLPMTAVADSTMYLIGGWDGGCSPYSTLDARSTTNPQADERTARAPLPTGRAAGVAGVINGKIYVVGGDVGCGVRTNANEVYDPVTNSWASLAPSPVSVTGQAGGAINGKLYVVGGQLGGSGDTPLTRNDVYDPATNTWSSRASIPFAHTMPGSAVVNGILYVISGQDVNGAPTNRVDAYNPASDTWTQKAPIPQPRHWTPGMAVAFGGRIYVCGGWQPGVGPSNSVQVYDPVTDSWTTTTSMRVPRSHHGLIATSTGIIVIGGYSANNVMTTDVDLFTPPSNLTFNPTPTPTPNQAPTIALTTSDNGGLTPRNGSVITAGQSFTLTASASDDHSVPSVAFLVDGTVVSRAATPPYQATVTLLSTGAHVLSARATDDQGVSTDSNSVTITIQPAGGTTYSFVGAPGADWSNPASWSPQAVPGTADLVQLTAGQSVTISGNVTVGSVIFADNSQLSGSGSLTVTNTLSFLSGSISGVHLIVPVNGQLVFSGASAKTLADLTIDNSGLVDCTGAGTITGNPATIINNAGTFTIASDSSDSPTSITVGQFNNKGLVRVKGSLVTTTYTQSSGQLDLNGYLDDGTPGPLSLARIEGHPIELDGGTLTGSGIIVGDLVNNGGAILPGHSAGILSVQGNYTQGAKASLVLEIGGSEQGQYDQLVVSGSAKLDGSLTVRTINNFTPDPTTSFAPLQVASVVTGTFAQTSSNSDVAVTAKGIDVKVTGPNPPPPAPVNISTRLAVQTGENVLIGGFIVVGDAGTTKKVLIRGLGPSLTQLGVPNALDDTVLELYDGSGNPIQTNDDWRTGGQEQEIKDTTIPPSDDRESAMIATLSPGNYTAIVRGKNDTPGVGQVEVYDLQGGSYTHIANISTRGVVRTVDDVMIGGFIVNGTEPAKVLLRAVGPSLSQLGVANPLADPMLEMHDKNGAAILNDDWRNTQELDIQNTTIPPTDDREAALITVVAPGQYTAVVRGKNNTTGIALVEVYGLK